VFKPMKEGAVERIVADLENDAFVKESIQVVPNEILTILSEANDDFLQGYLAGMSYNMNATSRVHKAMAEQDVVAAMQLKQFGNTIIYLLSKRIMDPQFDFKTLKKDVQPEQSRLIIPGNK